MRRITPLIFTLALGCSGDRTYTEGPICIEPETVANFADGDDLEIEVILDGCPPGCGGNSGVECNVDRQGDVIELDASGYYDKKGGNGACAAVCQPIIATCIIGGLAPGQYTINSGSHTLKVNLGSDTKPNYEDACPY